MSHDDDGPCFAVWYGMVWYGMVWYGMVRFHGDIDVLAEIEDSYTGPRLGEKVTKEVGYQG